MNKLSEAKKKEFFNAFVFVGSFFLPNVERETKHKLGLLNNKKKLIGVCNTKAHISNIISWHT